MEQWLFEMNRLMNEWINTGTEKGAIDQIIKYSINERRNYRMDQ